MHPIKTFVACSLAFSLAILGCAEPTESEIPNRPIKLIVNFSPGDTTDAASRLLISKVQQILGQKIFVTYRPGAGGTLGVSEVARQRGGGSVIGTCNMPAIALIPQMRDVSYDPFDDVSQIAAIVPYEYALLVRADSDWTTWEDFVDFVTQNPGQATYGSVGTGTTNHLVTARIGAELNFDWTHVPFQGGVKATAALLGGHVDIVNNTIASVASAITAGKIRALLITSDKRFDVTPETPTMRELGFNFSQVSYMSIIAPAGIDDNTRNLLEAAFERATNDEDVKLSLKKLNLRSHFIPGREYERMLMALTDEWGQLLPELGVNSK
jgi:tripartite-type tricarboxylate transporter receptor subunit TctC